MHDRNVLALDVIYHHLPDLGVQPSIPKEQDVSPLERWFHGAGEDDNDGRRRVGEDGESLPHHERRAEHEGEVEELGEQLAWLQSAEGEHFGGTFMGN